MRPRQKARPDTNRLDRSGDGALNATDVNAVEEALRIKEAQGGEVVVVSLGPAKAADSLRKALAMGADRAVLVSDDAAAGSDLLASSYALAQALRREAADLVLFGQQASDSDGAVMWAAVADRLRRPLVSQVAALTVEPGSVSGKRQTEYGYDVIVRAAACGRGGVGCDQRAALSVAQGDHGGKVEADRDLVARRCRRRGGPRRRGRLRHPRARRSRRPLRRVAR